MVGRIVILLVALTLLAAACGGGGSSGDEVASLEGISGTLSASDTEEQLLDFAQCMRDQGIDLPDPVVDAAGNPQLDAPPGFDPADLTELIEAAEVCEEFLEGIAIGFADVDLSAATDVLLEFSQCMRDNDFDVPDPDFSLIDPQSGSIPSAGPLGDIDFEDPDFLAALEVCGEILAELGIEPSPRP